MCCSQGGYAVPAIPGNGVPDVHFRPSQLGSERERASSRLPFVRDMDRIIHSRCFRRLIHKTQVFVQPEDDHYRTRLTHTLEVAQIGRSLAVALGVNAALTEAICLAHDLGHPPFGHGGEHALQELSHAHKLPRFEHNIYGLQLIVELEDAYIEPERRGLDLTRAVVSGLIAHTPLRAREALDSRVIRPILARYEMDLADIKHGSLEAQLAEISDDIAYCCHDIEDALLEAAHQPESWSGTLPISIEALCAQVALVATIVDKLRGDFPDIPMTDIRFILALRRQMVSALINDVIAQTQCHLQQSRVKTWQDIAKHPERLATFSPTMQKQICTLKAYMNQHVFFHPIVIARVDVGKAAIKGLFARIQAAQFQLPPHWEQKQHLTTVVNEEHLALCYIAGMTDNAVKRLVS